jgi:hypothetical protein
MLCFKLTKASELRDPVAVVQDVPGAEVNPDKFIVPIVCKAVQEVNALIIVVNAVDVDPFRLADVSEGQLENIEASVVALFIFKYGTYSSELALLNMVLKFVTLLVSKSGIVFSLVQLWNMALISVHALVTNSGISDKDEQLENIEFSNMPFDRSILCIFFKDLHPVNIEEKVVPFDVFISPTD